MRPSFKKAIQDLWIRPWRTGLVLFALGIGLWGVGSILVSYSILKNDLNENFVNTKPYHASLISKDFEKLNIDELRKRPEIESAEFRDLSFQRIEVFPGQWLPLWIFAVEDFERFQMARIYHESGSKPLPGTLSIERNAMLISNLKTDSVARIRVKGKVLNVPISGVVFDPAQAPATQDAFIYTYTDFKTFSEITGEKPKQRLIIRLKNAVDKQQVQQTVNTLIEDLKKKEISIENLQISKPNEHPHQFQLNTLLALQGGIGFLAFLMGAVLVSQLMESILAQQIRQIGILKAIGATRNQVLKIYMTMVLVLGLLSSVIVIPLAVISGYGFSKFVSKILNFNILTTSLPISIYLYLMAAGLLLPVLFTFPTLLKGTRISVQNALSDYGIAAPSETAVRNMRSIPYQLRLALRNVLRRKKRLAITVFTLALGVAIFNSGFNVRQSLIEFLNQTKEAMKYDVQLVLKNQISREEALTPFKSLQNIRAIETWSGGRGRLQSNANSTTNGIGLIALPSDTKLMKWDIVSGRWLSGTGDFEMVMNQIAADNFGVPVRVGETYKLTLKGKEVNAKLVGIVKEFDVAKIYVDQKQYENEIGSSGLINSLMFISEDRSHQKVIQLRKEIEQIVSQTDFDVFYVMSQTERAKIIYDHLNIILTLFSFLSALVLVVGALGMAASMGTSILERTREIGVMRAIGATPGMISKIFVTEGMIVSLTGIVLGLLLAWPISYYASAFFGDLILGHGISLGLTFSTIGLVATFIITLLFGWLASRIPALQAIRITNREALSYE